jgi:hypothetical protein
LDMLGISCTARGRQAHVNACLDTAAAREGGGGVALGAIADASGAGKGSMVAESSAWGALGIGTQQQRQQQQAPKPLQPRWCGPQQTSDEQQQQQQQQQLNPAAAVPEASGTRKAPTPASSPAHTAVAAEDGASSDRDSLGDVDAPADGLEGDEWLDALQTQMWEDQEAEEEQGAEGRAAARVAACCNEGDGGSDGGRVHGGDGPRGHQQCEGGRETALERW